MIPIAIDISQFAETFAIPEDDIRTFTNNVVSEVATEFSMYWEKEAGALGSARDEYMNSIYVERVGSDAYEVGLRGWLPNSIESGVSAFDMKTGFKNSNKVKYNKDGEWYLTIPFRFATPGALGESTVFTSKMPSEVYEKAKGLQPREQLAKKDVPKEFQIPKVRKGAITESKVFKDYQQKHSIYEGIQKKQSQTAKGTTYMNFRRVSENSDPDSWIHTGIDARNFAESALGKMDIPATVDKIVRKYIDSLI